MKADENELRHYEKIGDAVDSLIDIMLNYRQSGHPGGSRSKMHMLVTLMLSGNMRYDIRHPEKRFGDKFILAAGHTIPLVYATLAVLNGVMDAKYKETKEERFHLNRELALMPEDLLGFRRNKGLSGHAEYSGKTLFLKFNTGPSGHGITAAAGEALALKRAKANGVKVIAIEGDAGLTPGGFHETANSAWGLGLDNLFFLIDWNDYGIDDHPVKSTVFGTPNDWFGSHGWRVIGTNNGSDFKDVYETESELFDAGKVIKNVPNVSWFKTRKGRGYLKYDNASHGAPHKMNSDLFWETKKEFQNKYNVVFSGFGKEAPKSEEEIYKQFGENIDVVMKVLLADKELVDFVANRLVEIGDSVPEEIEGFELKSNPTLDKNLSDFENYPSDLYAKAGSKVANREAFSKWGEWVNAYCAEKYGRPLFLAMSADLADSTQISGFAKPFGNFKGYGWYSKENNPDGVLLPQEITEFVNSGISAGIATVNFSKEPFKEFNGFYSASSTYGSFAYLKYGMMRLFSQLNQDCEVKAGKTIWVMGHSGPETADDSRTHFGIFAPGVRDLFPEGHVLDLVPWEANEVPVLLGRAMELSFPIIALVLTRPAITIPDRAALGLGSHFEAAHGAYVLKDFEPGLAFMGTVIVQGTSSTDSVVKIIDELRKAKLNVRIVSVPSYELFRLEPKEYKDKVLPWKMLNDAMVITNESLKLMHHWIANPIVSEYSLSSDWDNRWRTGGTLDEVIEEAHLDPKHVFEGIEKFVRDRELRLSRLREIVE
ncbi:MAG: transketolase-like TK C-terminal-containing protein [Caldisericaceae bacterium]